MTREPAVLPFFDSRLLDVDLDALLVLSLGDADPQDPVLEFGGDGRWVDALREPDRARESGRAGEGALCGKLRRLVDICLLYGFGFICRGEVSVAEFNTNGR